MRIFAVAAAAIMAVGMIGTAEAADTKEVRICTGSKDGTYFKVGNELGVRMNQEGFKVQVVVTQGSNDNLRKMLSDSNDPHRCDVSLAQNDAIRAFFAQNGDGKMKIARMAPLYTEVVHFLCNAEIANKQGIKRIPDLLGKKNIRVAVGTMGSGVNVTWQSFVTADKRYAELGTEQVSGLEALDMVSDGTEVQCMIHTAALNVGIMKKADANYAGKLIMLAANDGDFDELKDERGKPVYSYMDIPAGTYRNLQDSGFSCMGSCRVKSVGVDAVLVYRKGWRDEMGDSGYSALSNAKNASRGSVGEILNGKK